MKEKIKWGYLREDSAKAKLAGYDKATGYNRTGLDEYLKVIFPEVDDWIHDKTTGLTLDGKKVLNRPDYRSEKLKMIVEFDGLPHYQKPDIIFKDLVNTKFYEDNGYKVVRIPYFIQLTNEAVKILFGVEVKEKLFDENLPSLSIEECSTPAFLCPLGIERMIEDFKRFPKQLSLNVNFLKSQENDLLTGVDWLE